MEGKEKRLSSTGIPVQARVVVGPVSPGSPVGRQRAQASHQQHRVPAQLAAVVGPGLPAWKVVVAYMALPAAHTEYREKPEAGLQPGTSEAAWTVVLQLPVVPQKRYF